MRLFYTAVRTAFDRLNQQTCAVNSLGQLDSLENALRPIIDGILQDVHTIFGVRGNRYTLEVWLNKYQIDNSQYVNSSGELNLECFYGSPSIKRSDATNLKECDIALIAYKQGLPSVQSVDGNTCVYLEAGTRKQKVYFNRYATSPIKAACGDTIIGVVVLTSDQEAPLADDVLETLGVISSLLSRFISSYQTCIYEDQDEISSSELLP